MSLFDVLVNINVAVRILYSTGCVLIWQPLYTTEKEKEESTVGHSDTRRHVEFWQISYLETMSPRKLNWPYFDVKLP